jgi:hypothetical protein
MYQGGYLYRLDPIKESFTFCYKKSIGIQRNKDNDRLGKLEKRIIVYLPVGILAVDNTKISN